MYFITTIETNKKEISDTRCVGYYSTFEKAENAVLYNVCDIWETCYNYAVIENIPEGIYKYDFRPKWYKYHKLTGGYIKCDPPEFIQSSIGYAIG